MKNITVTDFDELEFLKKEMEKISQKFVKQTVLAREREMFYFDFRIPGLMKVLSKFKTKYEVKWYFYVRQLEVDNVWHKKLTKDD